MPEPRRALIVIDVQNEYFEGPLTIGHPPVQEALADILIAMDAADAAGVPVAIVRHEAPVGSPIFAAGSERARVHPEVEAHAGAARFVKNRASVFTGEGMVAWLTSQGVDTVTLVGFMSNNCVLATAADAETRGVAVEVLREATGAIPLSNAAGSFPAEQVHGVLMALLHSNWARVASTQDWVRAVGEGRALPGGNLIESARR